MSRHQNRALEIHRKYRSSRRIVAHCMTVSRVAGILVAALRERGSEVDEQSVMTAAFLHDLGRSRVQSVHHGYVGAEIAESEGFSTSICDIIRKHVGAGISREEAAALGFPEGDYVPKTVEERVVCFADKMVDGERVRPFEEEVKRFVAKGHDVMRLEALRESIRKELGEDPERLVFSRLRA